MNVKECKKCKEAKPLDQYYTFRVASGELKPWSSCRTCEKKKMRIYTTTTPRGFLNACWYNMKRRVSGKDVNKEYTGLYILPRKDFVDLFENDPKLIWLLEQYNAKKTETSQPCRPWAPSIDRMQSDIGYTLDNIRFISQSYNSYLGTCNRNGKEPQSEAEYEMHRFGRIMPDFNEE